MIKHFLRLVWNRRRMNGLILVELILSFLVLCATLTTACYWGINWNKPLGFEYENLWRMDLERAHTGRMTEEQRIKDWETFHQISLLLKNTDEIVAASSSNGNFPYTSSWSGYIVNLGGRDELVALCPVTPEAREALGLELIAGRWLESGDETMNWRPVVITRDYANAMFGNEDPIGRTLAPLREPSGEDEESEREKERRVVGVIADYRMRSELRPAYMTEFYPLDPNQGSAPRIFAIRTRPGTTAAYQEKLVRRIQQIAPLQTVEIESVTRLRERELRVNLLPLTIFCIISGFLILMVGLGLVGVLWQAVTRRTEELGIRRALGATAERVRWQILGELLALTTVAVLIGGIMFIQMPILQIIHWMPWQAYIGALALSLLILYPFVILCGLYPGWLATRIQPAQALQYE